MKRFLDISPVYFLAINMFFLLMFTYQHSPFAAVSAIGVISGILSLRDQYRLVKIPTKD
jgi:hypothetical protein